MKYIGTRLPVLPILAVFAESPPSLRLGFLICKKRSLLLTCWGHPQVVPYEITIFHPCWPTKKHFHVFQPNGVGQHITEGNQH